jgi:hypothetical protein
MALGIQDYYINFEFELAMKLNPGPLFCEQDDWKML